MCIEMNKKSSFIFSDLRTPTAGRILGLTVMQQFVYQITFRIVYKFKKATVKFGLICCRTLSTLLSTNEESVSVSVFIVFIFPTLPL